MRGMSVLETHSLVLHKLVWDVKELALSVLLREDVPQVMHHLAWCPCLPEPPHNPIDDSVE